MRFIKTDAKEFVRQLSFSKRLEFLTIYPEEFYNKQDLYVAIGGGVGFGLTPEGELFNVFNNTGTKLCGRDAVDKAISKGAKNIFCFDGFLRYWYIKRGFEVYKTEVFDKRLAPVNWNYDKYGKPDLIYMCLKA